MVHIHIYQQVSPIATCQHLKVLQLLQVVCDDCVNASQMADLVRHNKLSIIVSCFDVCIYQ